MEASSTANDHLFSVQDIIAESWWDVQVRFASWALFELRGAHQSTHFSFNGGGELERLEVLGKGMCRCIFFGDHHDLECILAWRNEDSVESAKSSEVQPGVAAAQFKAKVAAKSPTVSEDT